MRRLVRFSPAWLLPPLLGVACLSPTLPLPPPEAPTVEPNDADHVKLVAGCGEAEPNAVMVIVNTNPQVPGDMAVSGSIADGCGQWDAIVYAHKGDALSITQEFGEARSLPTLVQVQ